VWTVKTSHGRVEGRGTDSRLARKQRDYFGEGKTWLHDDYRGKHHRARDGFLNRDFASENSAKKASGGTRITARSARQRILNSRNKKRQTFWLRQRRRRMIAKRRNKERLGSYFRNKHKAPVRLGLNGAASNDGSLIKWENVRGHFQWRRKKREAVSGRSLECCKKVLVSAGGQASTKQWDRMGLYYSTGKVLHGRMIYQNVNRTQSIFYILGEFDGWLLGPTPGVNYGGVKNYHDGLCVHTSHPRISRTWGYYDGPKNTKDPEEAFPYWNYDDKTLTVRCVPKTVHIDSKMIPDKSRGPMLQQLYRKAGPVLRDRCGPPLATGKLNMDAWLVKARCGGDCRRSNITLQLKNGQADILIVATRAELNLTEYCFTCNSYWAGRLLSGDQATWSTAGPGMAFRLYVIIVGYDEYVSLNLKIDSDNLVDASSHKLK